MNVVLVVPDGGARVLVPNGGPARVLDDARPNVATEAAAIVI